MTLSTQPEARAYARRAGPLLRDRLPTVTPEALGRGALAVGVIGLSVSLAVGSWPALAPFVAGLVIAYAVLPIANRLDRFMPRVLAALIAELVALAILVGVAPARGAAAPPRAGRRRPRAADGGADPGGSSDLQAQLGQLPEPLRRHRPRRRDRGRRPTSRRRMQGLVRARRLRRRARSSASLGTAELRARPARDPGLGPDRRRRRAPDQAARRRLSSRLRSARTSSRWSGSSTARSARSCGSRSLLGDRRRRPRSGWASRSRRRWASPSSGTPSPAATLARRPAARSRSSGSSSASSRSCSCSPSAARSPPRRRSSCTSLAVPARPNAVVETRVSRGVLDVHPALLIPAIVVAQPVRRWLWLLAAAPVVVIAPRHRPLPRGPARPIRRRPRTCCPANAVPRAGAARARPRRHAVRLPRIRATAPRAMTGVRARRPRPSRPTAATAARRARGLSRSTRHVTDDLPRTADRSRPSRRTRRRARGSAARAVRPDHRGRGRRRSTRPTRSSARDAYGRVPVVVRIRRQPPINRVE